MRTLPSVNEVEISTKYEPLKHDRYKDSRAGHAYRNWANASFEMFVQPRKIFSR